MDVTIQDEKGLLKKNESGCNSVAQRVENLVSLAPVGLKSTRNVAAGQTSNKPAYLKGDLVPDYDDELGEPLDDQSEDASQKLDRRLKKATRNRNIAASEAYQIEVETAALVRGVEDMLAFNRVLKEAWLFGKLDTLGQSSAEKSTDEHARAVAELLPKVINDTEKGKNKDS